LLLEEEHGHASIRPERIASGVGRIPRNVGTIDEGDRTDHPRKQQIVDDLGPLLYRFADLSYV
jgi:hypothetical protein